MEKIKRKKTKWTTELLKSFIEKETNGEYELKSEFETMRGRVLIKHKKCGETRSVIAQSFVRGSRCGNCCKNKKGTTESFKRIVFEMYGSEYEVIGEYVKDSAKIEMKHQCGLIYPVTPNNFKRGRRCPRCYGSKYVDETNCVATTHPHLVKEWDWDLNGEITPYDTTYGSNRSVGWKCEKGHHWNTTIAHRTIEGTKCPYCFGTSKITYEKSLEYKKPKIAKQWDIEKNNGILSSEIFCSSNQKAWWKCGKGHSWFQSINVRTRETNLETCPICEKRKPSPEYNLMVCNPDIAALWHPTLNKELTPDKITKGSGKEVWWTCEKGHDHTMKVRDKQLSCPICSSQKLHLDNCLATVNPELAKEWHPTKNGALTPYNVMGLSLLYAWWLCPDCGNEWEALISNRGRGRGCPRCCKMISKGERMIDSYLVEMNFNVESQYRFSNCRNIFPLPFDFAILDEEERVKCLIEYDGQQHFYPVRCFGGEKGFEKTKENDTIKNKYCEDNGIILIRIPYWLRDYIDDVLTYWLKHYKIL